MSIPSSLLSCCAHANGLLQKLLFRDSQPPRHSIQFIQDCSSSLAEKIFSTR
jgi:hypothetical protein